MTNALNKDRLFTHSFFHLFFTNLFLFLGIASLFILPDHLQNIGANKTYIGFFMNLRALELVIFVVFFGKYSNKINRKLLVLIGLVLFIISSTLMFFFSKDLVILLILNIFASTSFAFGFPLLFSMLYDVIPMTGRRGGAAIYGISGILSSPIGSFLGEKILFYYEPKYLFLLGAFFSIIALILCFFLKERHNEHRGSKSITVWDILKKKELLPLLFISLLHGGAFSVFASFIPNFTKERLGIANLSRFFIAFSFIAVTTRLFFFRVIEKISKKILLSIALTTVTIALTSILFIQAKWQLFIIGFLYGVGHSIMFPTISSAFINLANEKEKIIYNNAFISIYTLGVVSLSTMLGGVGDIFGMMYIFICMGCFTFAGLLTAVFNKNV